MRVLFILKLRDTYFQGEDTGYSTTQLSSGLTNSARFVNDMLVEHGIESRMIQVEDNNSIDHEVSLFRPDVVIVEAFWVVPEKFEVLTQLHPKVKWVIRNHSKTPFLATDGVGMDWALRYMDYPNVFISSNSTSTTKDIRSLVASYKPEWSHDRVARHTPYLPNYYPLHGSVQPALMPTEGVLNVGCFGAVRQLKNHLIQAVAAIKYADHHQLHLNFHINATRVETNSDPVLKNLRLMFSHLSHTLVEHMWMPHDQFTQLVSTMDLGLQVSYTETFNIVTADMVAQGIPVVVSKEIDWVDSIYHADPNDSESIVNVISRALDWRTLNHIWDSNRNGLANYNRASVPVWKNALNEIAAHH